MKELKVVNLGDTCLMCGDHHDDYSKETYKRKIAVDLPARAKLGN